MKANKKDIIEILLNSVAGLSELHAESIANSICYKIVPEEETSNKDREALDKFHALVNECFNKARGKRFQYHSGVTDKIKLLAQFAFEAHQHADDKIRAVQEQYVGLLVYVKMTLNFLKSDELSKRERITGLSLLKKHIEVEQKLLEANTIDTLFNEPKEGDLPF